MKKNGCFSCHKLNGTGSVVGPALDDIGTKREAEWMARWIKNPYAIKRNSRMPPFFYLPDEHIRVIAEYLSQQRGEANNRNSRPR
jgi:mono/diheme cytochrome c family protein